MSENQYIHGAYLQLTQLGKKFVWPSTKTDMELAEEKIQILFQIYIVCNNIAELALITDSEPEKGLIQ